MGAHKPRATKPKPPVNGPRACDHLKPMFDRDEHIWKPDIEKPGKDEPMLSGWMWFDFGHRKAVMRAWSTFSQHGYFDENSHPRSHWAGGHGLFSTEERAQAALDYLIKVEPMIDEAIRNHR